MDTAIDASKPIINEAGELLGAAEHDQGWCTVVEVDSTGLERAGYSIGFASTLGFML